MSAQDPQQTGPQTGPQAGDETVDYRLSPLVTVRFVGLYLVLLAILVFLGTAVILATGWSLDLLVLVALVGLVGLAAVGFWLRRKAFVVRAAPDGYTVRMIRGAGVKSARWTQVEDAITTTVHNEPCVVLRLKDGGTTTIPVSVLEVDKERFVRELQQHLQRGHRLR